MPVLNSLAPLPPCSTNERACKGFFLEGTCTEVFERVLEFLRQREKNQGTACEAVLARRPVIEVSVYGIFLPLVRHARAYRAHRTFGCGTEGLSKPATLPELTPGVWEGFQGFHNCRACISPITHSNRRETRALQHIYSCKASSNIPNPGHAQFSSPLLGIRA